MKNKTIAIIAAAICASALPLNLYAVPITGNIGFDGAAELNGPNVQTATKVVSWIDNTVGKSSGTFASIPVGTVVTLTSPWSFNSGPLSNFWMVDGFTFNLLSSSSAIQNIGGILFLNVVLSGTVIGNGFDPTSFSGTFQAADPAANGETVFTERLSFASNPVGVPDGAYTAMLLGFACLGLGLFKFRFSPA
jgi:hypothetical protein